MTHAGDQTLFSSSASILLEKALATLQDYLLATFFLLSMVCSHLCGGHIVSCSQVTN